MMYDPGTEQDTSVTDFVMRSASAPGRRMCAPVIVQATCDLGLNVQATPTHKEDLAEHCGAPDV